MGNYNSLLLTMSDGIELGETMVEETPYFNTEYTGATIVAGLLMYPAMASIGWPLYALDRVAGDNKSHREQMDKWNKATQYAWGCLFFGNNTWYGFLFSVWLFAYIKVPFFQESYWWSYVVATGLAVLNTVVVNVMFLVGGIMKGGKWNDLYFTLLYDFIFFGA